MKPATLAALMLAGYACAPLVLGLHGAQVLLAPLAPEYIRDHGAPRDHRAPPIRDSSSASTGRGQPIQKAGAIAARSSPVSSITPHARNRTLHVTFKRNRAAQCAR